MKISIEYKIRIGTIRTIELSSGEYFEGLIPKHGDTIKYVLERNRELKKGDIEYTLLTIIGTDDDKIERATYFMDHNEHRHTRDSSGWELVVQQIQVSKDCVVITRMDRDSVESNWKNIGFATILNHSTDNEELFRADKGEYITTTR